ncbi:unnamed protein product [Caenorhabditis bovis]|uniref:Histidine kinase/HSP90-like ATPase domain-containing protein n=1 Tax=Caenorhabditis bovis TaxID=2654633 RepID=A0A8S1ECT6_9PELO|nr:unnamed protein product [Caenorhabditis bovis]
MISLRTVVARLARAQRMLATSSAIPTTSSHSLDSRRRRHYATNPQRHEFQAETRNLMDIVAKSLYSHSEVFVRELISNASDALEKRRYAELKGDVAEGPSEIRIITDKENRTIIFEDTGIGMNRDDLVGFLGTIAKSGSMDFIEKNAENAEAVIGQFGVGFYSAFMVADHVVVKTRKVGSDPNAGLVWTCNGDNSYEIADEGGLPTGTRIEIKLKAGDSATYAEEDRIKEVINKYSYFVSAPILVNGERVNNLNAIWTMQAREVNKEMHETFFKQLVKNQGKQDIFTRPQYTIHFQTDTPVSIRSVIYIPQSQFNQLSFIAQQKMCGLSLYARRVLIKPDAQELIPNYLRFVIGVVDSEDIPLNLSREMLQNNPVLRKLKKIITDKILGSLQAEMKKDPVKYSEFYQNYSLYFKEGVVTEQDQTIKEDVAKLLLFESSSKKAGELTSLGDYVKRMQDGQKEIYYMYANNRQLAESSPYYEVIKSQNKEVLFLYDPADEVVFLGLGQFAMKNLVPVEKWAQEESEKPEAKETKEFRDVDKKELLDWMKETLGSVRVAEISGNHRPSDHPLMVTVSDMGAARHFLRTGEIKDMEHLVYFKPHVHVNLTHSLIKSLYKMRKNDAETARILAEQLYDNALITAGLIKDTSRMVARLNKLLTSLVETKGASTILTP